MSEKLIRVYGLLLISTIIVSLIYGTICGILSYRTVCEIERMVTEIRERVDNLIPLVKTGDYIC